MLRQRFLIEEYDWEVYVYYHITCYHIDEIIRKLQIINCPNKYINNAYNSMAANKLNTGFTYSNTKYRISVVVISDTSCPAQFMNSYDHERYHLLNDIINTFDINPSSEEAAYLAGHIGQLMFPKIKHFLCSCHNKANE